ncbi:MAG: peptide ABC transporter [Cupriavidus sp.]|nr:peptide ABC transporter [Cupriavidus sp.]MCA3704370.1 peptide ABC transporter [Methylobacterium sp.]MCA3775513.1 peptide ABC transporter [Cutibacterium sp.]
MKRIGIAICAALGALATFALQPAAAKDNLVINMSSEAASLDPHLQWTNDGFNIYLNVFDQLLKRDEDGRIRPNVATSWTYLSETEVEFTIRGDIKFHDGAPLTANDVVFTIKRITDPAFGSPQLPGFRPIARAEVVGNDKVKVVTNGPYPLLLTRLAYLSIVPKHVVEAVTKEDFGRRPVGSGPYKFERWQPGVGVTLVRNDQHWDAKGAFQRVEFRPVPDAATRIANLRTGAADFADRLSADQAAQLRNVPNVEVRGIGSERVGYLRMNATRAPLDDPRVRRAIAIGIDRAGIVQSLLTSYDPVINQMLTPDHFGFDPAATWPAFNPAEAKALVAAAGERAKVRLDLATSPLFDQRVMQAIQQMLADIGLNVAIEQTDHATFVRKISSEASQQPMLYFGRWSCGGCGDADGVMWPLLHSGSTWAALKNPAVDALLDQARQTVDQTRRKGIYGQVNTLVREQFPLVPVHQTSYIVGVNPRLTWKPLPTEILFLNRMGWRN